MSDVEVRRAVSRYGSDGGRGTVLMLPGRAYPCELSLLAWTTAALHAAGWSVLQARWQLAGPPEAPRAFVESVLDRMVAALEDDGANGPVVVVAKSLGTLGAVRAADRGLPGVWLTPVLSSGDPDPLPPDHDLVARRIRDYPAPSLVVGGTADPMWERGFRGTGHVLEIDGADHALETDDWSRSIRVHAQVAEAVAGFVNGR